MPDSNKTIQLGQYGSEDIFDLILKLERSFGLKLRDDAFAAVSTFGDCCNVFEQQITAEHRDDCTSQQAFYKVRQALAVAFDLDARQITPQTPLAASGSWRSRYKKIKSLQDYLDIPMSMYYHPDQFFPVLSLLFLLAFTGLFFYAKIAGAAIILLFLAGQLHKRFDKRLRFETAGQLARALTNEHYHAVRRSPHTVNRKEIREVIIRVFSEDLGISVANLTPEARFIWTG